MIKVMLLDDDVPVVEYLRKLVPWDQLGLEVCAEAYSAEEAKELFDTERPDILITDIGLPDGNGIHLARDFRSDYPDLRVIFLTCHEDFHYVKEALRIEADDYIVKDELNLENITESIRKALGRMNSVQIELEKIAYKSDVDRNKDLLTQNFFHDLLLASEPEVMLSQGRRLGIEWKYSGFSAALCHLDLGNLLQVYDLEDIELVRYAAMNIASELAIGTNLTAMLSREECLWIIGNTSNTSSSITSFDNFLPILREKLNEFLKVDCFFTVDDQSESLHDLRRKIDAIKKLQSIPYYDARHQINIVEVRKAMEKSWGEVEASDVAELTTNWVDALSESNRSLLSIYLGAIEKLLLKHQPEPEKTKEILVRLLQQAVFRLGKQQHMEILVHEIRQTNRLDEALRIVRWFGDRITEDAEQHADEDFFSNPDLKVINAFIQEHIHKNITSIDIARHLHLNPSYFSRYFKKMAGINFTDNVHLIKMAEAKRLLTQKHETAENAAYMLGYSDRAYFSKVFKKYTGKSPSEYKQIQEIQDRSDNNEH